MPTDRTVTCLSPTAQVYASSYMHEPRIFSFLIPPSSSDTSASTSNMTSSNQYQHFVPQFLLRNFAHPYKPDNARRRKGSSSDTPRCKPEKGMYRNNPVVRNVDLTADPPTICEKPVARILGQMNMYRDTSQNPDHQQHIEELFGKLESRVSCVFRKITKAFEEGEKGLWFTRDDRNLLRKFLFILKYRGSTYFRRFCHESLDDYVANDREKMREYMVKKGFVRPLDVWFDNIKAIVELEMDPGMKWMSELKERMYMSDEM